MKCDVYLTFQLMAKIQIAYVVSKYTDDTDRCLSEEPGKVIQISASNTEATNLLY